MEATASSIVTPCLNILRRTPPHDVEQNVAGLFTLLSSNDDIASEFLQRVDCPLETAIDSQTKRPYIICDHNRDGDSHRSPWSNRYDPPLDDYDGLRPSPRLRTIEILANEAFDSYRELYYGGTDNAVSSVYLWDITSSSPSSSSSSSFAGAFLIRKMIHVSDNDRHVSTGYWNSVHVVEVTEQQQQQQQSGMVVYKLTTSLLLDMTPTTNKNASTTSINIGGSLSRQMEKIHPLSSLGSSLSAIAASHVAHIGAMIEDMEIEMRSTMDALYIQKTKEVVMEMRQGMMVETTPTTGQMHTLLLNQAVLSRNNNKT